MSLSSCLFSMTARLEGDRKRETRSAVLYPLLDIFPFQFQFCYWWCISIPFLLSFCNVFPFQFQFQLGKYFSFNFVLQVFPFLYQLLIFFCIHSKWKFRTGSIIDHVSLCFAVYSGPGAPQGLKNGGVQVVVKFYFATQINTILCGSMLDSQNS